MTQGKKTTVEPPALTIPPEKVFFILAKARQFEAKEGVTDPDSGSNASDDAMRDVLEDTGADPVRSELVAAIRDLNEDEQIDLVALAWLGRGDGDVSDWDDLRAEAARAHNRRTATYLLGMPLLAAQLEEGLNLLGYSFSDDEAEHF
jgi:ADP-ribose pyrophosphatase YjhB (NUDIX family)